MKVMITGGAGFIGQHIAQKLTKVGYEVSVFDIRGPSKYGKLIKGNVFDFPDLKKVVEKHDVIVHLVGLPDARAAQEDPMESFKLNVFSLQNVLEACRLGNKKIIFPSTAAVYGVTQDLPINENHPLNPNNVYSWHKSICEKLILTYSQNFDVDYVILRLFNVYGRGNKGVIYSFVDKAKRGDSIEVFGVEQYRDFVHAGDVADAFYSSIIREAANRKIINIGSGKGIKIKEILQMVHKIYPNAKVVSKESKLVEYDSVADISLAKALLNFRPQTSKKFMEKIIKEEIVNE